MSHPNPSENRGPTIDILVSVFTSISIITSAVRLYCRGRNRQLGWDDHCIALCFIVLVLHWAFILLETHHGYGQHEAFLTKEQGMEFLRYTFVTQVLLYPLLTLPKLSIGFFIFRIKDSKALRWFLVPLMVLLVATNLACVIALLVSCQPVHYYWSNHAKCGSSQPYNDTIWVSVSYSIFSDLACTLLPIFVLWNVQMRWHLKFAVVGLMSLGLLATVAGTVRAYYSAANNGSEDPSYDLALITILAILETQLAVIGANFAVSKYIYNYFRDGRKTRKRVYDGQGGAKLISQPSLISRLFPKRLTEINTSEDGPIPLTGTGDADEEAGFGRDGSKHPSQYVSVTKDMHIYEQQTPRSSHGTAQRSRDFTLSRGTSSAYASSRILSQ